MKLDWELLGREVVQEHAAKVVAYVRSAGIDEATAEAVIADEIDRNFRPMLGGIFNPEIAEIMIDEFHAAVRQRLKAPTVQ